MAIITYINANGTETKVTVATGVTLMHGAINNMIDGILAECGGAMTCATCHCYIDQQWLEKTGSANSKEKQKLRLVNKPKANSRLSCQITVNDELNGLIVRFPETQVWNR